MPGSLLSPRTLARFRRRSEANHPHLATRITLTETYGEGGVTTTVPVDGDEYPCRLVPAGAVDDQTVAEAKQTTGDFILCLPITATVSAKDRFRVEGTDADGEAWTRTVEVIGTPGPHSNEVERQVRCTAGMS